MGSRVAGAAFTMASKHLGTGSICPPLGKGILRIYSMRYCPFAQRTLLVLLAKNIKHEVVNVNMKNKPDWFLEKNPLGKVPILEKDGQIIYESLITSDFLEEVYPDPPLYPKDPWEKAKDRILMDKYTKVLIAWYKIIFAQGKQEVLETGFKELFEGLDIFETELKKRGTKFFYGDDKPGMLDYMIWPWAERLTMSKVFTGNHSLVVEEQFPALNTWIQHMMTDPPVKETFLPIEEHLRFMTSFDDETRGRKLAEASKL